MKTAIVALLLLSLTACQAFPPGSGADGAGDTDAGSGSGGEDAVVSGLDAGEPTGETRPADRRVPAREPPELPPRDQLGEERLTGLTTNQTWDLLGPPSQVEESPATVWTYEVAGCRLELFFYFDLESQQQRTLALDLEAASDFVGSRPFCWYTLAKRGRDRAAPMPQAEGEPEPRESARVPTADELDGAPAEGADKPSGSGDTGASAGASAGADDAGAPDAETPPEQAASEQAPPEQAPPGQAPAQGESAQ